MHNIQLSPYTTLFAHVHVQLWMYMYMYICNVHVHTHNLDLHVHVQTGFQGKAVLICVLLCLLYMHIANVYMLYMYLVRGEAVLSELY